MTINLPRVTIITPSYNQGDFISETILSVLGQDYSNIEYIIVDGGSTDSTPAILSRFKALVSLVISESDKGQASAINKGIMASSGDIIGWINSDDVLYEDSISAVVQAFARNPEVEVVYGNTDYGPACEIITHTICGREFSFIEAFRRLEIPMPQQGCFWRRAAIDKCGLLNEDYHYVLDRDYFIRLADSCVLLYVDRSMGLFRSHSNSKSIAMKLKWSDELIRLYSSYCDCFPFRHPVMQYKSEVMAAVFASAAFLAFKSNRLRLCLVYLGSAFRWNMLFLFGPFARYKLGFCK